MQANIRKVLGLPAVTESGTKLGKVIDVIISTDTHAVRSYEVRHHLIGGEIYSISPVQVKAITDKNLVVEDAFIKDAATAESVKQSPGAWSGAVPSIKN